VVFILIQFVLLILISLVALFVSYFYYFKNAYYQDLFELEGAFEGELDFIHLSKEILSRVVRKTGAFGGMIYWFDEAQKEYKLKTLVGIPAEKINRLTSVLRQSQGILDQLPAMTESFIIKDVASDHTCKEFIHSCLVDFCRAMMVIPLRNQKKNQGVLLLFKAGGVFKEKHLRLMNLFQPRATMSLDNARLYQLAKETALENTRLYLNISKLYKQATLDELTGLYNRNFFMQRIKEEIKKSWRLKQPLSLIFLDIDFFKQVNDQHGHQVGDQLLAEFGSFIKKAIREYDVPCRFGGEEFIILLPHTKLNNAFNLAERLRKKLAEVKFCKPQLDFTVTASFGVSILPEWPDTLNQIEDEKVDACMEELISAADDALYRAKSEGRNRVKTLAAM
jgi:diguanylate cyclase (GGDEF)-like protein